MLSRSIALDIGNVCLDLRIDKAMGYFGLTELSPALLAMIDRCERGLVSEESLYDQLRTLLPRPMSGAEIKYGWNLILGEEKYSMATLIHEGICMGYRFVFFSDTSPSHFYKCVSYLSFAHLVDGRIVSYEVGAKKPEDKMFEAFEFAYGVPAFYFDDKPENIAAAREKHGWNAAVFTTPELALKTLREFHLKAVRETTDDDLFA